jgi:hypothetical protein
LLDDARNVGVVGFDHGRHDLAVAFDKFGRHGDGGDFRREGVTVDFGQATATLGNYPAVANQDGGASATLAAASPIDADDNLAHVQRYHFLPPRTRPAGR